MCNLCLRGAQCQPRGDNRLEHLPIVISAEMKCLGWEDKRLQWSESSLRYSPATGTGTPKLMWWRSSGWWEPLFPSFIGKHFHLLLSEDEETFHFEEIQSIILAQSRVIHFLMLNNPKVNLACFIFYCNTGINLLIFNRVIFASQFLS